MFTHRATKHRSFSLAALLAALVLFAGAGLRAQEPIVSNGQFADGLNGWTSSKGADIQVITVSGQAFTHGLHANLPTALPKPHMVQLRHPLAIAVTAGQKVHLSFWARSPQKLDIAVGIMRIHAPYTAAFGKRVQTTDQWTQIHADGRIENDVDAGVAQLVMSLATGVGEIELSDVKIDFEAAPPAKSKELPVDQLPAVDPGKLPVPGLAKLLKGEQHSILGGPAGYKIAADFAKVEVIPVTGQHFDQATQITVTELPEEAQKAQASQPTRRAIAVGDKLLALFSYRAAEFDPTIGYSAGQFRLEEVGGAFRPAFAWGFSVADHEWHHVVLPFESPLALEAGKANVLLRVGYGKQTIEIGGLAIISLPRDAKLSDFPRTPAAWVGSAPDAAWRAEAAKRIEQYRKANGTIRVVNAAGQPVPGARVEVDLAQHLYGFGSAFSSRALGGGKLKVSEDQTRKYLDNASKLFNAGVMENEMKWMVTDKPEMVAAADRMVDWMHQQGWSLIRGHNLVWPGFRHCPGSVQALASKPEELRQAVRDHVAAYARKYASKLAAWDVVNEPYKNHDITDILGEQEMAEWFKIARREDPKVQLYFNDFGMEDNPSPKMTKASFYFQLIDKMRGFGAEVDGIGLQSHFSAMVPPIPHFLSLCDAFAARNVAVEITEYDWDTDDEATQGAYIRDYMTAAFSHPSTNAFMLWGFWAKPMHSPRCGMLREDFSYTPAAAAWVELTQKQWHTHEQLASGSDGAASWRGFKGTYSVTVSAGGKRASSQLSLLKDGDSATIQLK